MDETLLALLRAFVQVPTVGLAFWFGWKIYQQDQKRIDYLISIIVAMCHDEDANAIREALKR